MGRNHVRVLSEMTGVSEVVLFDPLIDATQKFLGLAVLGSLQSLIDTSPDYCVVSTPTVTHHEVATALAKAGIPALIEKPISSTIEEGRSLVKVFEEADLLGAVGHIERYNPAVLELKRKLDEGVLGQIYQVTSRRIGPYSGRVKDVGVIKDLASHDIHLVRWLTESSYESLSCLTSSPTGGRHEDSMMAIAKLKNGVLVNHLVNWISPTKERVTTVLGENGLLIADTLAGDLFFYENGVSPLSWDRLSLFKGVSEGPMHKYDTPKKEPLVAEHEAFQAALGTKDSSHVVTLAEGLEALEVATRLIESGSM
jgi:UDP-N-acetylglucosamine 3-dehydrogenase